MKEVRTISISYPDTQNHYKVITYPDGQRTIEFSDEVLQRRIEEAFIEVRVKEFADLEIVSAIVSFLNRNDIYIASLTFTYLIGMRSDRTFSRNTINYFKDVIAPIINSWHISRIRVFCPHSKIITRYIKNSRPYYFDYEYLETMFNAYHLPLKNMFLIGADESFQILNCGAHFKKKRTDREIEVSLDEFEVKHIAATNHTSILVIDDLCDGGKTFIRCAEFLEKHFPHMPRYLFIGHALFSQGTAELLKHYEKIICTDSYRKICEPNVIQFSV